MLGFNSKSKPEAKPASKKAIPYTSVRGQFSLQTDIELESRLAGNAYKREFHKMAQTDAVCGAVLLAINKIFQSIEWKTVNDSEGILAASMENAGWTAALEDILTHLVFGHSVMEVTLIKQPDGRVLWNKLHFRPQTTIVDWKYNTNGDLLHIEQSSTGLGNVEIPANKCLIFHTTRTQTTPNGKSLFRNAYRDWYYKTNIEKIESIGIERDLTGLPVLTCPEDEMLQDADGKLTPIGDWAWKTVRNIKQNAQEGLVLPARWTFELAGSPGKRQFDLNAVINRYSNNIALSMLSQFLVLGVTNSSGSFALAKEQSSLFHIAVEGFANAICNVVNTQFIGGKALKAFNGLAEQPKLKAVGIERIELGDLASFLGRLLKYNIITPDDKLEEYLRDRVALPPRDETTSRIADIKLSVEAAEASTNKDSPEGEEDAL